MSYYRLYPERNNTIFRYGTYSNDRPSSLTSHSYEDVNCGANPVMELMDGKGESKLVFGFNLPQSILQKLKNFTYTVKLQLWDAGTLYEPPINLQTVRLETFNHNFSEGDGYAFFTPEAKKGISNWVKADSVTDWADITFTQVEDYEMNRINEDYNFDVSDEAIDYLATLTVDEDGTVVNASGLLLNFALSLPNRENNSKSIFRKYIHSAYTKTVFKPYLEFYINDFITDSTLSTYADESNRYYLVNKNGKDFPEVLDAIVTEGNVDTRITGNVFSKGVIYIDFTPTVASTSFKKEFLKIKWVDSTDKVYQQNLVEVKNQVELTDSYDFSKLFFYPTSPSTHNIIRQGDNVPFSVISEIRGDGVVVINTYEYRVTSADGFEMIPWSKVSVYRDKMYFNINTEYFYPEQQYEVTVRNRTGSYTLTSPQTHKFKVAMNDKSHLRELTSSPYYSRTQNFSK